MSKKTEVINIFSKVANKYDFINNVISFGVHKLWEKKLLSKISLNITKGNSYQNALDLCTGTGALLYKLSLVSKNLYALDISNEMLDIAKKRLNKIYDDINDKNKLENIKFYQGEAEKLPFNDNFFDLIVVSYGVRNFYDLNKGLQEIYRCLSKNGIAYILEFGKPILITKLYKKSFSRYLCKLWQKLFIFYFSKIMPLIVRIFSKDTNSYRYLSKSALSFPSDEEFVKILSQNGLHCSKCDAMLGGFVYLYTCNIDK